MSRPPLARERVLDAFERLLIDEGERAATIDATARAAEVSKGGLLYHFASKDDLAAGLLDRLERLVAEDLEVMDAAADGPIAYYVRTSVMGDAPLDLTLVAATRLAQGGHEPSAEAVTRVRRRWEDALRPHVRDDAALALVMLVSDGLYFNNALISASPDGRSLAGPVPHGEDMAALVDLVLSAAT